jgi:hypothetical protein
MRRGANGKKCNRKDMVEENRKRKEITKTREQEK